MRAILLLQAQILGFALFLRLPIEVSSSKKVDACPQRPTLVREALENDDDLYYFGLGSNMLRSKLENRSICGSKINLKSMEPAFVENYRLAFNIRGFPPLEPAMGSIEPVGDERDNHSKPLDAYEKNQCHGALVRVSASDYEKIMRSEGVGNGRPDQGYEELVVEAMPYQGKQPVKAIALRAREHVRLKHDSGPSRRYMEILRQGADELGLDPCYRTYLENHPVATSSALTRKIAVCNLFWTVVISFRLKIRLISKLQSWLLWRVYAPPSANKIVKLLSELATIAILLPGAIPGSCLFLYQTLLRKEISGMMKSIVDSNW